MTPIQKRIAILTAFGALILVAAMLLTVLAAMLSGRLAGNSFPGSTYLLIVESADDIGLIFGGALIVVTAGMNFLGRASTKPWILHTSSAICIIGLIACLFLFLQLKDADVARPVWNRAARIMTYDTFQAEHKHFIQLIAGWLGTFLATQLCVTVFSAGGSQSSQSAGQSPPHLSSPAAQRSGGARAEAEEEHPGQTTPAGPRAETEDD